MFLLFQHYICLLDDGLVFYKYIFNWKLIEVH